VVYLWNLLLAASQRFARIAGSLEHLRAVGSRLLVLHFVTFCIGCGDRENVSTTANPSPSVTRPSVTLRVLVVNDPQLATAINRLRGEWSEREGGTLMAESKPWADVAAADSIDADIAVFPARYLGELADRLRPIRESVAHGKLYDAEDLLPLVRDKLGMHGGHLLALPLSVQIPLIGYQDDLLKHEASPDSWKEYLELVSRTGEAPAVWPDRDAVDSWPAIIFLARAAAYACHPRQESPLFDADSMEPRIAGPPFVRALDEWRQELTNAQAPKEAGHQSAKNNDPSATVLHWAEIPGADQVFNISTGEWEPVQNPPRRVPLLAGGTLVAVTSTSRNAASAFGLAAWLTSSDIVPQILPAGAALLPCRRSNLSLVDRSIVASTGHVSGAKASRVVEAALGRDDALLLPRIPGVDQYLGELAAAVDSSLQGGQAPGTALEQAATKWNEITERLGRDAQRRAYLHHLGQTAP
jgi:ABC-type glycerol-3-phosphate transport system substrate-binding protein